MINALAEQGFVVVDDFLPADQLQSLQQSAPRQLQLTGKRAGIGRGDVHVIDDKVRGDHIAWLAAADVASAAFLDRMEQLRVAINQRLFLGLFRYESHFACYEPGAFYRKHVDAFKGERNRLLSTVFYLNEGWLPQEGGELLLYRSDDDELPTQVLPQANRLVVFLSEEFPHEVLPATRTRLSIAGWFRGS